MGPYFYYYDPTYILVFIGVILSLLASAKVKSTFSKYSNVRSMSGMTGAEAAQKIFIGPVYMMWGLSVYKVILLIITIPEKRF